MQNYFTLSDLIDLAYQRKSNSSAFNFLDCGKWRGFSNREFALKVKYLALGLRSIGLKKDRGFGIVARPSPIWLMADFAAIANRAISVPIFPDIAAQNLLFEIKDADVKFVFCDDRHNLQILQDCQKESDFKFEKIIIYGFKAKGENIIDLEDVIKNGQAIYEQNGNLFADLIAKINDDDLATIIYTSGSTGKPKGVELTHKNLISQIKALNQSFTFNNADMALSFLPLAHIFERMVMYLYIANGVNIYFVDDVKNVGNLMREVRPTLITVVPRLLEKVFNKMQDGAQESHLFKKYLAKWAFALAQKSVAEDGKVKKTILYQIFDFLVYKKLRNALGGNLRMMICGGAALPLHLERFFCGIGIKLYIGYGTTESSPVIAVNTPKAQKIGTVGKAISGVEVKLNQDGELLAKGDNIMKGYHNNKSKTNEVVSQDGWLNSQDLAKIDRQGFIKIIGRKKEMFKTATGKYVSPVPIEQKLLAGWPMLCAACIIAEGRKFVSCLLFADFDLLAKYKNKAGLSNLSDEEFLKSDFVEQNLKRLITKINSNLNYPEQIKKYQLITQPISIKTGELTPSMKLRRNFVEEKYQDVIEGFYTI